MDVVPMFVCLCKTCLCVFVCVCACDDDDDAGGLWEGYWRLASLSNCIVCAFWQSSGKTINNGDEEGSLILKVLTLTECCCFWHSAVALGSHLLKCSIYTSQKWVTLVTGYRQLVWTFPQVGRRTGNLSILPWCVPTPSHYYHSFFIKIYSATV